MIFLVGNIYFILNLGDALDDLNLNLNLNFTLKEEAVKAGYQRRRTDYQRAQPKGRAAASVHHRVAFAGRSSHLKTTPLANASNLHRVAGLSCEKYGGPSNEIAVEMVYWRDIRSDETFSSPLYVKDTYLTFETDEAGWNNVRMAMETAVMMAIATGRTLVLPPSQEIHHLGKQAFGFMDFFHLDSVQLEHTQALRVITFKEFLERVALQGHLKDEQGHPSYPLDNRTDWNGMKPRKLQKKLWDWLRNVTDAVDWDDEDCLATFPSQLGPAGVERLDNALDQVLQQEKVNYPNMRFYKRERKRIKSYTNHPTPVNASLVDRLAEVFADRDNLCMYDETLQNATVIHLTGEEAFGSKCEYCVYSSLSPGRLVSHSHLARLYSLRPINDSVLCVLVL
jgi:hypothetical protein